VRVREKGAADGDADIHRFLVGADSDGRWRPGAAGTTQTGPVATLQALSQPVSGDKWIYRMVVIALGLTALFVVIGVFTLKALDNNTTIPDALVAIGSAAIAALAALLAPSPTRR